jgi:hypothetical protein
MPTFSGLFGQLSSLRYIEKLSLIRRRIQELKMTTNSPNIEQLRIATPCPVSWDQMTGDNRVRFCDHCRLNVYNISELSKLEAQKLIASQEGRLCARLFRRADGTILTKDCPVGLRALRLRVSRRVAAVLAAVAGIANLGFGQTVTSKDQKTACPVQTKITHKNLTPDEANAVSGSVQDVNGAMIPNANILLILTDSNKTKKSSTNDEGRFSFAGLAAGIYSLKIEVPGFNTVVVKNIVLGTNQSLNIDMTLQVSEVAVVGLFAEPNMIDTTSSSVTTTISGDMIRRLPIPQ